LSGAPSNAGTYTVVAAFTRTDNNYTSGGSAQTTFSINPAAPTVSVTDAGGTYNGNPFPAVGSAVGVDGKTAVSGSFSYTYYAGSSASGAPLSGAPFHAGTYTVVAAFTSSDPNYTNGAPAQHTFTINPASTTTTAGNATITFSDSSQNVTLTANVHSAAGAVNEGAVTFTVFHGSKVIGTATTSATLKNSTAGVSYVLPGRTGAGTYTIDAVYNPGPDFLGSSDSSSTVTIAQAAATLQLTNVTVVPNIFTLSQTETITLHIFIPSGPVSGGIVAITLDGHTVSAAVDANGNAAANLTLPLLATAFPQSIHATYSGPDANGSSTTTANWQLLDGLLPSVASFAADGGHSVQTYLFGLPLFDFLYNSQGQLTEVVFGPDLLTWVYSYTSDLILVHLDNMLLWSVTIYTPQGQNLGTVALTPSADGTLVVELIDALGQVVSSQSM